MSTTGSIREQLLAEMDEYVAARRVNPQAEPPAGLTSARDYIDALTSVIYKGGRQS